jgi:hypothetical protein
MGPITLRALIPHQTLVFVMKREFVNKTWIFCTPVPVLRIHLSTQGKPGLIRGKKTLIVD